MEDERWLMMAVLDHLHSAAARDDLNTEPLEEAIFAISNAYSLNMRNSATKERYPLNGLSLPEVYKVGRAALLARASASEAACREAPDGEMGSAANGEQSEVDKDEVFRKFIARLKDSTKFFDGVLEGTPEYEDRLERARKKFEAKRAEKKRKVSSTNAAGASSGREDAVPPNSSNEERVAKAAKLKVQGNDELKASNFQKAHDLYTECIELDGSNAVYYSNRAAANLRLSRYSEAVEDCKVAISLDPEFVRPRERLAEAYRRLNMTQNEVDALKAATRLAPDNEALASSLRNAEARLSGRDVEASQQRTMGGNQGAGGGLESLLGMASDPNVLSNMSRAMGLPDGMVQQFMNSGAVDQIGGMIRDNPGVVQQAMQAMMGNSMPPMGGGAGNNAEGNAESRRS